MCFAAERDFAACARCLISIETGRKQRTTQMNRIYQGRVTKDETLANKDGNSQSPEFLNWQSALWLHHEYFQDAVKLTIL
jgi:hypothetical protein